MIGTESAIPVRMVDSMVHDDICKRIRGGVRRNGYEEETEGKLESESMKNTGKGSKLSVKGGGQEVRKERKSGTGMNGSPKKGGHGGKFTWAGDGYSPAELGSFEKEAIDANDPIFEEPEEALSLSHFPNTIRDTIEE
ncbi:Uncharacterized protein Fot_34804 [Forsythia ovata]|uniref:Programmed cell death protein 4 n=1 Tax=Forsythia ovata TaxID=205694 RepID=A0ABD1SKD8_9LAMI